MRIFKDYTNEFNDLKKEITNLRGSNKDKTDKIFVAINNLENNFEKEIIAVQEKQDIIFSELKEIKQLIYGLQPAEIVEEEIEIAEEVSDEVYWRNLKISDTFKQDFKYNILDENTFDFKYKARSGKIIHSSFNIFDVLLIRGLESEQTWRTWGDIEAMVTIKSAIIKKIAYNLKKGFLDQFDISGLTNFSKEYGILYINGKSTNIPIRTVKYIVNCMVNSRNPFTTFLKLEKTGEFPKLAGRVIAINYTNSQLLSLLHGNPVIEPENNPEKRKEKGL